MWYMQLALTLISLLIFAGWLKLLLLAYLSMYDLFNCKRGAIAHSLSLSPLHCPDRTEILLERMQFIHPLVNIFMHGMTPISNKILTLISYNFLKGVLL